MRHHQLCANMVHSNVITPSALPDALGVMRMMTVVTIQMSPDVVSSLFCFTLMYIWCVKDQGCFKICN